MAFGKPKDEPTPTTPATPSRPVTREEAGSLIAQGMVLDGNCETDGALRVDGHVKGDVSAGRLTIGADGRVDGDVKGPSGKSSDRAVVIEGRVGGAVKAHRVEVAPGGSVGSGLTAHEAVVRGHVKGPIDTEHRLILEETATVEGNVTATRLGLKEGGQVFGTIRIGKAPGGPKPTGS